MNNLSELQAVVVSYDTSVLDVISSCLNELGIAGACHPDRDSALGLLQKQKIDAFFVDQDLDPDLSVLEQMRSSSSGRGAVGFGIVTATSDGIRACRAADFIITKPLTKAGVARTLRAAYGMMLKERRRYSRHNLRCEAILCDATGRKCLARTTNISQTGIALECELSLPAGAVVQLQVALPRTSEACKFEGRVIWSAANGKAGLTFTHMSTRDRESLTEWVDAEFLRQWHPVIPQSVAPNFVRAVH
jgi:DNA-binding response OmpR family regulator